MPPTEEATPLRLIERVPANSIASGTIRLSFDARSRSRLTGATEDGREVTILLSRGTVMRGGDKLATADGIVIEVAADIEPLLEVRVSDPALLARAAYHLGNRHVAVQVLEGGLRVADDAVLGRLLSGLGLEPIRVEAPFEPEGGAYGERHTHSDGLAPGAQPHRLSPVIHEFRRS